MTTTSAFLQEIFWVPGVQHPRVLPAPARGGWSPPAFPSCPAGTVPRPAPASQGQLQPPRASITSHRSSPPGLPSVRSWARQQALLTEGAGTNKNRTEEKSYRIPPQHSCLPRKPRERLVLGFLPGECQWLTFAPIRKALNWGLLV